MGTGVCLRVNDRFRDEFLKWISIKTHVFGALQSLNKRYSSGVRGGRRPVGFVVVAGSVSHGDFSQCRCLVMLHYDCDDWINPHGCLAFLEFQNCPPCMAASVGSYLFMNAYLLQWYPGHQGPHQDAGEQQQQQTPSSETSSLQGPSVP